MDCDLKQKGLFILMIELSASCTFELLFISLSMILKCTNTQPRRLVYIRQKNSVFKTFKTVLSNYIKPN